MQNWMESIAWYFLSVVQLLSFNVNNGFDFALKNERNFHI